MTEYDYWLWLAYAKDMWNNKMHMLLQEFESPREIYNASEKSLKSLGNIKDKDIDILMRHKKEFDVEKAKEMLNKKNINFTYYNSKNFPDKLKRIPSSPLVLFYKGKLPESTNKTVAIVGARVCTEYGRSVAYKIAKELSLNGVCVISGLARGIDSMAHIGCIDGDSCTYAVLGCGVDICYPRENIEVFNNILNKGGIISEYIPGSEPLAYRFPERNRIIAGLADVVIMIEAKEKSGSFITIDHALEQGKTVYALPGRLTDPLSVGCNRLIVDGAVPLVSSEQILQELRVEKIKENKKNNFFLEKEYEVLYSCLGLVPVSIDELIKATGLEICKIYEGITYLQMNNMCKEVSKGQYTKISSAL
jgi:DNA processing protein